MYRLFLSIKGYFQSHPQVAISLKLALSYALIWQIVRIRIDPDFGWHLQAGNYVREHGIPDYDVFTYTASSFRWINHEWGGDYILSLLYPTIGYAGLAIVFSGIWLLGLTINNFRLRAFTTLTAILAISPFIGVRSATWTFLLFAVQLKILRTSAAEPVLSPALHAATANHPQLPSTRRLLWLLPLIIAWANLHAGFMLGLAVIGLYFIRTRQARLILILLGCVMATFINPYGPRLYVEVFQTLLNSDIHHQIEEWYSFAFTKPMTPYLFIWITGFVVSVFGAIRAMSRQNEARKAHPIKLKAIRHLASKLSGLSPILLAASCSAIRHLPLFVVAAIPDTDTYLTHGKHTFERWAANNPHRRIWKPIIITFGWLTISLLLIDPVARPSSSINTYPSRTIQYLKQNPCSGNLFNNYNLGGYIIWQLPGQKVFIDGRMPHWKDASGQKYYDRYASIFASDTSFDAEFMKYDIQCALVESYQNDIISRLEGHGWKIVSSDTASTLLTAPNR